MLFQSMVCVFEILDEFLIEGFSGHLRLLDFDFRTKLIEYIFSLISIHDWTKDLIPIEKCATEMRQICPK